MTNEVEKLIIENSEESNYIAYEQSNAYLLYKEIWKFILSVNNCDYKNLLIKFVAVKSENKYFIPKSNGISFELIGNGFKYSWDTFYNGCEEYDIKNLLNTNIDIKLFFKLLYMDGFDCDCFEDENYMVYINIDKYTVNKNINNIQLKNKILKKEM